jgi:hypothetical protein
VVDGLADTDPSHTTALENVSVAPPVGDVSVCAFASAATLEGE